jgi:hypothetical protein
VAELVQQHEQQIAGDEARDGGAAFVGEMREALLVREGLGGGVDAPLQRGRRLGMRRQRRDAQEEGREGRNDEGGLHSGLLREMPGRPGTPARHGALTA